MKISFETGVMLAVMLFGFGTSWALQNAATKAVEKDIALIKIDLAKLDTTEKIHGIELWIARWEGNWPELARELHRRPETVARP